jgi:hypothetical protein
MMPTTKISTINAISSLYGCGIADDLARQQCLYFLPLPHGQGAFRPTFTALFPSS